MPSSSSTSGYAETLIPLFIILLLNLSFFYLVWRFIRPNPNKHALRTVTILVLGDIGRSPRMMYHAESFAKLGFTVDLVGYPGSNPIPALLQLPQVHIHHIAPFPTSLTRLPFILLAPLKIAHQLLSIFVVLQLEVRQPPEFLLVQNPPTIPTLAIAWITGWARGSKVIIDWHNLGYSILALKLGNEHPFVNLAKKFEKYFGKSAYAHIFVTKAMHDNLVEEWGLSGHKVILHDRSPKHFHRCEPQEIHDLFMRVAPNLPPSLSSFLPKFNAPYSTPFTTTDSTSNKPSTLTLGEAPNPYILVNSPELRNDRPALIISSTSWTEDEDFGVLIDALTHYEQAAKARKGELPKVFMIVTGKGPLRSKYMKKIGELEMEQKWEYVRVVSLWLEAADYPLLLGSADLGISLHSSSSGLDLPMKVVDMFGCCLPVCALDFSCLNELVKPGINGLIFRDEEELASQLEDLLNKFPSSEKLQSLRSSIQRSSSIHALSPHASDSQLADGKEGDWYWNSWEDNWNMHMKGIVLRSH